MEPIDGLFSLKDDDITRNIVRYDYNFDYSGQATGNWQLATGNLDYKFQTINEMFGDPNNSYFDPVIIRVQSESDTEGVYPRWRGATYRTWSLSAA